MMPEIQLPGWEAASASSPHVQKLCARLSPDQTPVELSVTPEFDGHINDCFPSVDRKIARDGGSVQYGWQVMELPGLWVEAEFHAVWRSPDGQLVDVTPKQAPVQSTLFLPDLRRIYEGRQIPNEFLAISKDPLVQEHIDIQRRKFTLLNRGERAQAHGEINLVGREAREYERLASREQEIMERIVSNILGQGSKQQVMGEGSLLPMHKPGRNDPCPCGSGRKYKRCCGS